MCTIIQQEHPQTSCLAEPWCIQVDTGAAISVAPKSFASDSKLSPAPSTLQLTTAKGKAVKIYGLRHVHLQSQGLSLPVRFVIADFVEPLLGLDDILEHCLSLQVSKKKRYLVNLAGGRTQLEHLGGHLCMIAFPFPHGLTHCFSGSLSQVIGRQLSDKEFREQSSASQSSSSTDLDEDQSKLKGELGSLDFQCHSVLPDPSTASEDELVSEHSPCKGEVQVSGGELRVPSLHPENLPETKQTSKHEELHNTNRTIFRERKLNTNFFSQTFRAPPGYPGKIPGYPAQKV